MEATKIEVFNKKVLVSICPACKFLGSEQELTSKKLYKCSCCEKRLKDNLANKDYKLAAMFALHNKNGFKCCDCNRFIPKPLDNNSDIVCPYFDCSFIGNLSCLIKMKHPSVMKIVNISNLDQMPKEEALSSNLEKDKNILIDIIESELNSSYYTGSNFTRIHYISMYEAFKFIINKYPDEMISYLINLNRGESLQCKIFQQYIFILEKNLPFVFKKNGKNYKIESLLDENLCLFDGISKFEAMVNLKKEIKNNTQEFYIGGRTGSYSKPFYIGKLLDIVEVETGMSILSDVNEY